MYKVQTFCNRPAAIIFNYPRKNITVCNTFFSGRECGETMFTCNLSKYSNCIHRRFTCDGYQDCEMGEDEDKGMCGEDKFLFKLDTCFSNTIDPVCSQTVLSVRNIL